MSDKPSYEPDDLPWDRPGAVRRDCSPHRGDTLLFLAKFCLFFGALSCILHILTPIAMLGGLVVREFAIQDLKRIRAGRMDPAGETLLRKAKKSAGWGFVLGFASLSFWSLLGLLIAYGIDWFDSHMQ